MLIAEPAHGWLVTAPSNSPENAFLLPDGGTAHVCLGSTADMQILRYLFAACGQAAQILGRDGDFAARLDAARARLAPTRIGPDGRIMEWLEPYAEADPHHRHVAHLWGLYPGNEISTQETPALAGAAKQTLDVRGDEGTGWSLAYKALLRARLGDGDHAFQLLRTLLRPAAEGGAVSRWKGGTYANLFDSGPPFQIDGNFGGTAAIAEMLMQSGGGQVNLLPALPRAWPEGSVRGLCARGGCEVDMVWAGGRLISAALRSGEGATVTVRYAGLAVPVTIPAGAEVRLDGQLRREGGRLEQDIDSSAAAGPAVPPAPDDLAARFTHPPASARPWVYWYWMNAAVSRAGITADLTAMKSEGIAGAYLMPIKGPATPPLMDPPAVQLSPQWWDLLKFAFAEADRLGVELSMHACDGFSIGGGPWITPEQSMQTVVWSEMRVSRAHPLSGALALPPSKEGYYRDIAVLAFPATAAEDSPAPGAAALPVRISSSVPGSEAGFLAVPGNEREFRVGSPCWIQYEYAQAFTCRSIRIHTPPWASYQANRLRVETSDDGVHFQTAAQLACPRHGWQDGGEVPMTHAIAAVSARFFRFVYDPENSEPGSEELDSAKFGSDLRITGLELSGQARLDDFEGKAADAWRVGEPTPASVIPAADCVPPEGIVDLTGRLRPDGSLDWAPPPGEWTVLRMGHTSNGHRNDTGGGGAGLECDKLSAAAAREQFDHWFGAAIRNAGPALAGRVLKIFHVDSWECGCQNWTADFRAEFLRRRGYDPQPFMPALAGIPVGSAVRSERYLRDVRTTIGELMTERFFGTLEGLAREHGCQFSAECVAPTMESDGMLHYGVVDIPMGEFWLRSPSHDKPNDIRDAVSGAHIYGRPLAQSEAFTELNLRWDEQPALLKPLGDRIYCIGINRFVYHVFVHNPWTDRRPGMTLNHVGTFFQRDQTWWRPGRAWVDYCARCQALLQAGRPVVDVAVFTGEEMPRRAVLPGDLAGMLPQIAGPAPDPDDPLRGYAYDSINRDALMRLAQVKDGRIELPGGASYAVLVIPGNRPMNPDAAAMTPELAGKLAELVRSGARVLWGVRPSHSPSLQGYPGCDAATREQLAGVQPGPFEADSLLPLGIAPDFLARDPDGGRAASVAWTHRSGPGMNVYFVSNQSPRARVLELSLRVPGGRPGLWDPVTGDMRQARQWRREQGRTLLPIRLEGGGSQFVVFDEAGGGSAAEAENGGYNWDETSVISAVGPEWEVAFDPALGGPARPVKFAALQDWTGRPEPGIRSYSGTARYSAHFSWDPGAVGGRRVWLDLGQVADLAEVFLNGVPCGVAWTPPYRTEITPALRAGENRLVIAVTNTWANRLLADGLLPEAQRVTWTTGPSPTLPVVGPDAKAAGPVPPLPAGLMGPVFLIAESPAIVPPAEMQRVYNAAKTPYKYGIVLRPPPGGVVDCPSIFRFGNRWCMVYVCNQGQVGYETFLATSPDLLHWTPAGRILPFSESGWDAWQADGGAALVDPEWGGSSGIQAFDGRYWMSYLGGAGHGYEPDPLSIGLAWTRTADDGRPWTRLAENPVLSPGTPDARAFERKTLYKSQIVWDRAQTLGYPFVMFYNGKKQGGVYSEKIGMAVSRDLRHWTRYGAGPVVDNGAGISGDPQIVRMGPLWVMFYFGAGWRPHAFDTFACSPDLVHWTRWAGPSLIVPSEAWDATYAHKPWLIEHDGVVYHFYCAVGSEGRALALATSRPLK